MVDLESGVNAAVALGNNRRRVAEVNERGSHCWRVGWRAFRAGPLGTGNARCFYDTWQVAIEVQRQVAVSPSLKSR